MSWSLPKTWAPGEMVDAPAMNQHVRDNLAYLKERVDGANGVAADGLDGSLRNSCYSWAYATGIWTSTAGVWMAAKDLYVGANLLSAPGDALVVDLATGTANDGDGGAKYSGLFFGVDTSLQGVFYALSTTTPGILSWVRYFIMYRSNTTALVSGQGIYAGANVTASAFAGAAYPVTSLDFTVNQLLRASLYTTNAGAHVGLWGLQVAFASPLYGKGA